MQEWKHQAVVIVSRKGEPREENACPFLEDAVSKKKKVKGIRESLLPNRVYSKNFVVAYGFCEKEFGIFFGLNKKISKPVKRNRIKRIFRSIVRENLLPVINDEKADNFSICLISKRGIKFDDGETIVSGLRDEIQKLVERIIEKIR